MDNLLEHLVNIQNRLEAGEFSPENYIQYDDPVRQAMRALEVARLRPGRTADDRLWIEDNGGLYIERQFIHMYSFPHKYDQRLVADDERTETALAQHDRFIGRSEEYIQDTLRKTLATAEEQHSALENNQLFTAPSDWQNIQWSQKFNPAKEHMQIMCYNLHRVDAGMSSGEYRRYLERQYGSDKNGEIKWNPCDQNTVNHIKHTWGPDRDNPGREAFRPNRPSVLSRLGLS